MENHTNTLLSVISVASEKNECSRFSSLNEVLLKHHSSKQETINYSKVVPITEDESEYNSPQQAQKLSLANLAERIRVTTLETPDRINNSEVVGRQNCSCSCQII